MNIRQVNKQQGRRDFMRRLGYYLFGVAIGCVMVGLMLSARAKMRAGAGGNMQPTDAAQVEKKAGESAAEGGGEGR